MDVGVWTVFICSDQGQVAGCCECGNEPSGSIKCGEFLDQLRTSQLLKKNSAPWSYLVSQLASQLIQLVGWLVAQLVSQLVSQSVSYLVSQFVKLVFLYITVISSVCQSCCKELYLKQVTDDIILRLELCFAHFQVNYRNRQFVKEGVFYLQRFPNDLMLVSNSASLSGRVELTQCIPSCYFSTMTS